MDHNEVRDPETASLLDHLFDYLLEDETWLRPGRVAYIERAIQKIKTADSTAAPDKSHHLAHSTASAPYRSVAGAQQPPSLPGLPRGSIYSPNSEPLSPCITAEATTGRGSESNSVTADECTDAEDNTARGESSSAFLPPGDIELSSTALRRVRDTSVDSPARTDSDLEAKQTNKKRRLSKQAPLEVGIQRAQYVGDGLVVMEVSGVWLKVQEEVRVRLETMKTLALKEAKKKNSTRARKKFISEDAAKPTLNEVESIAKCTLFWSKVFGKYGVSRIFEFMEAVRAGHATTDDDPVLDSNEVASHNARPASLRGVLEAYHRQANHRRTAIMGRFLRLVHLSDFNKQYSTLVDDANDHTTPIREIFRLNHMETSRGRSWASLVNDYLIHCLHNIDLSLLKSHKEGRGSSSVDQDTDTITQARSRLRNEVFLSQPYRVMERTFGRGVFLLLPEPDVNR